MRVCLRELIEERDYLPSPLDDDGADYEYCVMKLSRLTREEIDAMKGEFI